ncbi:arginine/serine-rich protein PNISR-like isoform X2 [Agrilus planipennis]|uniref:Arginine/serine-rich protein PNISR-like isoform X2 n=1 Tax=Agrilus planipennis TaxID=224129 RepID=A0A7F5RA31_AGRPL|nr:arginine/serine-rich protein PNISR-like isoform X2 [Agrilus planipennis]
MNSDSGSQGYAQWPLNPSAYQNTANDQVDWAALAQQWIIMKEAGPPVPDQIASTAVRPLIEKQPSKQNLTEAGEAPMDVENEKDEPVLPPWNDNSVSSDSSWSWNQQQQQWNWANTWTPPSGVPPPGPPPLKAPLLPTPAPFNQYNSTTDSSVNENYGGYSTVSNDYTTGYWTTSNAAKIKPHNKRYSKVNVPRPAPVNAPEPVTLDANKRKQLPAWIREGLEKMERDKQKMLEKERERLEREQQVEKTTVDQTEAMEIIRSTVKQKESKSKFESDEEPCDHESDGKRTPEVPKLSQEDLMLKVRRTMTEILLKVTNKQILEICKEELQRHLRKNKASDQSVSAPSGTNITNRLGLGMYEDMESSSDNSSDEQERKSYDSDTELKNTIRKKKAEFSKTERLIEEKLSAAERNRDDSRAGTPRDDINESQVDANNQGSKRRPSNGSDRQKRCVSSRSSSTSSSSSVSNAESEKLKRRSTQRKSTRRSRSSYEANSDCGGYSSSESSKSRTPETRFQRQISRESEKSKPEPTSNTKRRRKQSKSPDRRRKQSKSPDRRRKQSKSPGRRRSSSTEKVEKRKPSSHRIKQPNRRSRSIRSRSKDRRSRSSSMRSRRSDSHSRHARSRSRKRTRTRSRSRESKHYKRDSGSKYGGRRSEDRKSRRTRSRSRSRNRNDRTRRRSSSRRRSPVSRIRYHRSRTRSRSRGKRSERR